MRKNKALLLTSLFVICLVSGVVLLSWNTALGSSFKSHVYGYTNVSTEKVHIQGFYVVPKDRSPIATTTWQTRINGYLSRISAFHNREFGSSSQSTYDIYPNVVTLDKTSSELRASDYYHYLCDQVMSKYPASSGTFTNYLIFADWGMKDNVGDNCAIPYCTEGSDKIPYQQCGGDGGGYLGSESGNAMFGCGLVSESTWKGSKQGVTTVMYHEGVGHPLNMPHSDPPADNGVMGLAGWYCKDVENAVLETSIKNAMIVATPTPNTRPKPSDFNLKEGDIISSYQNDQNRDVFIINEHGFKRLFLNEVIFSFYGHLGFNKIRNVSSQTRNAFETSGLFRNCETNDQKIYAVEVTAEDSGILHPLNMTADQAISEDPEFFNKVFCINNNEFNWYPKNASAYTHLSQVPRY